MISELTEGLQINETLLLISGENKTGKTGVYGSGYLSDQSGKIPFRIWETEIDLNLVGQAVKVVGTSVKFNDELQLKCTSLVLDTETDPLSLLPHSKSSDEKLHAAYLELKGWIKTDWIQKLLEETIEKDPRYFTHPAAKTVHQAFIGGLAEHSEKVALVGYRASSVYPADYVNRDIVVAAGLLHDIGKLDELKDPPEFDYTLKGDMLGHPLLGAMRVEAAKAKIDGVDERDYLKLIQCIISHPGTPEYGAIQPCKCAEAMIVNAADLVDSKVEQIIELKDAHPEEESSSSRFLGGRVMF